MNESLLDVDRFLDLKAPIRPLAPQSKPKPVSVSPTNSTLTERKLEVLQLAAKGERSKEIAYKLGITERTIKAHLQSVYQKFGVDSRAAAVAVAAGMGLLGDTINNLTHP